MPCTILSPDLSVLDQDNNTGQRAAGPRGSRTRVLQHSDIIPIRKSQSSEEEWGPNSTKLVLSVQPIPRCRMKNCSAITVLNFFPYRPADKVDGWMDGCLRATTYLHTYYLLQCLILYVCMQITPDGYLQPKKYIRASSIINHTQRHRHM